MGQQGSRVAAALTHSKPTEDVTAAATSGSSPIDITERLSLAAPNAAVIGAGVAGVHVAYELAKIGFKVTVFERRGDIAGGETRHSLPFVGVGLVEPSLARAALRREILRGLLFPSTCPDVIAREHLLNTVTNPVVYRWMWGRLRSCFTDKEAMVYTDNLSRVSHTVVRELVEKHPHLQQHIFTGPVTVLNERKEVAATAHAEPIMVDPVGWTRALADVCRTQLGVQFALGERVEDTTTYLKYDVESTKSIRVSKQDPLNAEKRVFASEGYDVVVLAAGAGTGTMTLPNSRLPILGLSGLSATVQQPMGGLKDALWSLFQRKPPRAVSSSSPSSAASEEAAADSSNSVSGTAATSPHTRPALGTLAMLSPQCSLYAYTWPSAAASGERGSSAVHTLVQSKVLPASQDYVLQGLLSLDNTFKTSTHSIVARQLERLESYLRIKCHQSVPLSSTSSDPVSESAEAEAARGNAVHVREYVRAFTPDGVPLIDHNGGAFNCFVCSGFGDQAMDFAPGAAKVLGKLVEHEAQRLREEDLENVKTWGVLSSKLSPSRRAAVEDDLQALFNGIVPDATLPQQQPQQWSTVTPDSTSDASTASAAAAGAPPVRLYPLHFEMNPFSTNRFSGLVPKEVKNVTTTSWLEQLYAFEDRLLVRTEPYRVAMHHKMMDWAQRDNVPDTLRTIVFCYFYDESDDPEVLREKEEFAQGLRKVASTYERSPAAVQGEASAGVSGASVASQTTDDMASLTPGERSRRKQTEMERQARELFSKP